MKRMITCFLLVGAIQTYSQTAASYGFNASTEAYNSIQEIGTEASVNGDDLFDTGIPIGFTFGYCGTNYVQLYASSNGYVSLPNVLPSTGAPSASNNLNSVQLLTFGTGLLCPFWDDLDGTGRHAYYATLGSEPNRVFVFEWVEFGLYGGLSGATNDTLNFQIKLYETSGTIQFCYGPHNQPSLSATIGIFNSSTDYQTLDLPSSNPAPSAANFTGNISSLPEDGQVYTWSLGPISVSENNSTHVKVFPNPSDGRVNVLASESIEQVVVFDALGQLVTSEKPQARFFSFDLEESGCYFMKIVTDYGTVSKKINID
ncbi:MAG: T9SS type A sorting domain-containing protein [Flavobacteriales bacterium]|nr:T9SS type A sorting domain-containing protein [Flavobacteriales bacterium]